MLRDKRRAEERLAATKHQQPQTNNGQQQGHKQAGELQENYVEFLPTTDKKKMNEARTQRVHNTACLKTDKLKWGCQRLC